jgi:hypothetical protein
MPASKLAPPVLAKLLALLLLVAFNGFLLLLQTRHQFEPHDFDLDASWIAELEYQLRQGSLLGRDAQFTYGPLAQAIAWGASLLRADGSALHGVGLVLACFGLLTLLAAAAALLLVPQLDWRGAVVVYCLFVLLLNNHLALRPMLPVLATLLLARALDARPRRRAALAAGVGLLWFAAQLVSFDLVVFGAGAGLGALGLGALLAAPGLRHWPFQRALPPSGVYLGAGAIAVAALLVGNLAIELFYRSSAAAYEDFAYLRYSLAIARGYAYTLGYEWQLGVAATSTLLAVLLYSAAGALRWIAHTDRSGVHLIGGLLTCALLQLRSAVTRSDSGHVLLGFVPMLLLFALVLYLLRRQRPWLFAGVGLTAVWMAAGLAHGSPTLTAIPLIASGAIAPSEALARVWRPHVDLERVAPPPLRASVDPDALLVSFPYDNAIAIGLGQRSLAPVLQTYAAGDLPLQEFYVREIERRRQDVEVIYGLDRLVVGELGDVQTISRSPVIFAYLYERFALKTDQLFRGGWVLLAPRATPRPPTATPLQHRLRREGERIVVEVPEHERCAVLALTATVRYPWYAALGRPNDLRVEAFNDGQLFLGKSLVPLAVGRPFTTYLYLGPQERFVELLRHGQPVDVAVQFDQLTIAPSPRRDLDIDPASVELSELRCLVR